MSCIQPHHHFYPISSAAVSCCSLSLHSQKLLLHVHLRPFSLPCYHALISSCVVTWYIVKQAEGLPDIKIVNFDWFLESTKGQGKADEAAYEMAKPHGVDQNMGTQGTKRSHAQMAVQKQDSDDEKDKDVMQPPAKKQKDVQKDVQKDMQKASSTALSVPVDDGCNLSGMLSRRRFICNPYMVRRSLRRPL